MQISKIALSSALLAVASAQTTDGSFTLPDLNSLTSAIAAGGTGALGDLSSALSGIQLPSIPSQYSSLAASIQSEVIAAGTNTAKINSIVQSVETNLPNLATMTASPSNGGASGGGSSGSSNGGSGSSGGSSSSTSSGGAAPTAVKAGGALAAAGLAALAFL